MISAIKQIERIAKKYYTALPYHNFQHALQVRKNAIRFARRCRKYNIPINQEVIEIAALFHDAGYWEVKKDKEEHSAKIAEIELKKVGYPEKFINKIKKTIMATKGGWPLRTAEQKVIRAADLLSFAAGYKKFWEASKRIQKEYGILYKTDRFPVKKWTELVESYLKPDIQLTPKYKSDKFHVKARRNIERFLKDKQTKTLSGSIKI